MLGSNLLKLVLAYPVAIRLLIAATFFTLTFYSAFEYLVTSLAILLLLIIWVIITAVENKDFPILDSGAFLLAFRYIALAFMLSISAAIFYFYFNNNIYAWISITFRVIFALVFIFNGLFIVAYLIHRISLKWDYELAPYPGDLKNITNISVKSLETERAIELNQQQVNEFSKFLEKGRLYHSMKTVTLFEVVIIANNETHTYYFHYDSIGSKVGGFTQTVFKPKKEGLREFLKEIESGYNPSSVCDN